MTPDSNSSSSKTWCLEDACPPDSRFPEDWDVLGQLPAIELVQDAIGYRVKEEDAYSKKGVQKYSKITQTGNTKASKPRLYAHYRISMEPIQVQLLPSRKKPETTPPTTGFAAINQTPESNDADGQKWLLAAEDVHTVLLSSHLTRRIKVKLLSWQLTAPRTMLPLEPCHPLVEAWTRVNSRVHTVMEETARLQEAWKSIDVLTKPLNPHI